MRKTIWYMLGKILKPKIDKPSKLKNGWQIISYKGKPIELEVRKDNIKTISGYGNNIESCKRMLRDMMVDEGIVNKDILTYVEKESGIENILEIKITFKNKAFDLLKR